jgi:glycosyl transferase family 25
LIPVFLINLDGSDARLAAATAQLDELGVKFERVAAFDGRGLEPSAIEAYDEAAALAFTGRRLSGGEVGCFLSHRDCARRFLDTGEPYGMVLEDDMEMAARGPEIVADILGWLESEAIEWDLINLGPASLKISTALKRFEGTALFRAHYFPVRTSGLIWSRRGAAAFLADERRIFAPVDNYFRDWMTRSDTGLSVWPALISQGAESEISDGSPRKKLGRVRGYKWLQQKRLWREKTRAFRHKFFGN